MIRRHARATLFPYTTLFRSLIDAGVAVDDLRRGLESLAVTGWTLTAERVQRHALSGMRAQNEVAEEDRKSTRLNSSHQIISYAVFCLKKKNNAEKKLALTRR